MRLQTIDFTDYLETRRRMRLLPNLFDFGIAYGIFRPITNLNAVLRPLASLTDRSVPVWLYHHFTTDPVVFFLGAIVYAVYALVNATISGLLGVKLKNLVLSDSATTIWIFLGIFLVMLVAFMSLNELFFVAAIPGIYVYACCRYLWLLRGLKRHPLYCHLVGVPRRTFAFSTTRYDFLSRRSLVVYGATFRSAGKLAMGYLAIGLYISGLIILSQVIPSAEQPIPWIDTAPKWLTIFIAIIAIIVFAQPVAYVRRYVANEWLQWTRTLRANLARSAKELSFLDERPPILFLRSFQDDRIEVANERYWGHAFLGIKDEQVRLEEVLAETLYAHGPLVALSNPRDALGPLGAARENVAKENWQDEVRKNMELAEWIVLVVGSTPSLRWEMAQLLGRDYLGKTILVFPPSYHNPDRPDRFVVHAIPELASALGIDTDEQERRVLDGVLVISWKDKANVMIIRQDGSGEARGYADAVRLAAATCFKR